jgi:predicted acetyltransferase
MSVAFRAMEQSEYQAMLALDERAFGHTYPDEIAEAYRRLLELDRFVVAVDSGEIVGSAAAWSFDMTVPGGAAVPTAGVTWVAVSPTHRRRGILRSLMEAVLHDAAARGEPVAALTASESGIYRRFGFGPATERAAIELLSRRVRLRGDVDVDGRARYIDGETARKAVPELYDRYRRRQPGTMSRNDAWWDFLFLDHESRRNGASAYFYLLHPDGFAAYRSRFGAEHGHFENEIEVDQLVAVTPAAYASLWQVLLSVDLVERVSYGRAARFEPLPWLLEEPRQVRTTSLTDDVWLYLLDVPAALAARSYAMDGRLVLEVDDRVRPVAAGRFELEGGPDGARCRPTTASPDLVLGAAALGSISIGGHRPSLLAAAGLIEENASGALARADALFASTPPPHNQTSF